MALTLTAVSTATAQGRRPYQEDRFFTFSSAEGLCFGVFDGHGGDTVADIAQEEFPGMLVDELGEPGATPQDVLLKAFARLNEATKSHYQGSSASVVFLPWSGDLVHVAVLGDSPVVIKRADGSIWHGPDHNVRSNKDEAAAAQARGGFIINGYLTAHFSGPGLQMARALGDVELAKVLSRTPEISTQVLGVGSFVLVATDGAFDPGHENTNEAADEIVALIQSGGDAQAIVNRAVAIPTGDNVTALLVRVEANEQP